jgi:hypothetical protein
MEGAALSGVAHLQEGVLGVAWLKSKANWTLELSNDELLLVLKALGGRLQEEEVDEAKALDIRLSRNRATALQRMVATADQITAALDKEGDNAAH